MDQIAASLSSYVNLAEDVRLPVIPYGSFIKSVVIGIPIAVLLHDTAEYWIPTKRHIPIISWFMRRWRRDPDTKKTDLLIARNVMLFAFFIITHMNGGSTPAYQPSDYVEKRLTSATAGRTMNTDIHKARGAAFGAANELLGEEEMNTVALQQQRDAVLRRRHVHDSRAK